MNRHFLVWTIAISMAFFIACGDSAGEDTSEGSAASEGAAGSDGAGTSTALSTSATATSLGDASSGEGTSSDATSSGADTMGSESGGESDTDGCFVDFPCSDATSRCDLEANVRLLLRDIPCEEICGDVPCHGSQCEAIDSAACALDTTCVQVQYEGDLIEFPNTSCVDDAQVCGGPEGLACPEGSFCETSYAVCACTTGPGTCPADSPHGRCIARAADCGLDGPTEVGCDGTTYDSPCLRRAAGVDARWEQSRG